MSNRFETVRSALNISFDGSGSQSMIKNIMERELRKTSKKRKQPALKGKNRPEEKFQSSIDPDRVKEGFAVALKKLWPETLNIKK